MTTTPTTLRRILALDAPTLAVDFFLFALKAMLLFVGAWAVIGTVALHVAGEGNLDACPLRTCARCVSTLPSFRRRACWSSET